MVLYPPTGPPLRTIGFLAELFHPLPLNIREWNNRQTRQPNQVPAGQPGIFLDAFQGHRLQPPYRADVDHNPLGILAVQSSIINRAHLPDDGLVLARVVEKDPVAALDLA